MCDLSEYTGEMVGGLTSNSNEYDNYEVHQVSDGLDPAPQALFAEGGLAPLRSAWSPLPLAAVATGAAGLVVLAALLAGARRQHGSQGDDARHMLADLEGPEGQLQEERGREQL